MGNAQGGFEPLCRSHSQDTLGGTRYHAGQNATTCRESSILERQPIPDRVEGEEANGGLGGCALNLLLDEDADPTWDQILYILGKDMTYDYES